MVPIREPNDPCVLLRSVKRKKVPEYWKLYMQDPFHSLVNLRLSKVLALLTLLV